MRRLVFAGLLLAVYGYGAPCYAFKWNAETLRTHWLELLLGFSGTVAIHELGHIGVATATGTNFEFEGLSIVYPDPDLSDSDRLRLASAGFQTQWLTAEIAFRTLGRRDPPPRARHIAAGAVLGHLGITLIYMTLLKHHDDGDVEGMAAATGLSNSQVALALAVPATLDAYRLFAGRVPGWVPKASIASKGLGVTAIWTF